MDQGALLPAQRDFKFLLIQLSTRFSWDCSLSLWKVAISSRSSGLKAEPKSRWMRKRDVKPGRSKRCGFGSSKEALYQFGSSRLVRRTSTCSFHPENLQQRRHSSDDGHLSLAFFSCDQPFSPCPSQGLQPSLLERGSR